MNFDDLQKLYDVDDSIIFEQGILVFDTSALLDLYFYSQETAEDILDKSCYFFGQTRMFLPAQVKFEFDKNREKTLLKPLSHYESILNIEHENGYYAKITNDVENFFVSIDKQIKKIQGQVQTFGETFSKQNKHPYLSNKLIEKVDAAFHEFVASLTSISREDPFLKLKDELETEINMRKNEIHSRTQNDTISEKINDYFTFGRDYKYSELLAISKEGEMRYNSKIPPGYMDKDKIGFQRYGDLFVWKQLLEYAQQHHRPFIFVSNDTKEDWNEFQITSDGKKSKQADDKKARYELLLEFNETVGKEFKKLTLKDFIFELNDKLTDKFGASTLEEIKLEHLNKLILEEKDNFIDAIKSEIISTVKKEISEPAEAYDYEIEDEDIYISFSSVTLPDDSSEQTIIYEVEVTVICEMLYWEYWGRDDDTKQAFLSPEGMASWNGTKEFKIYRDIEVDFESNLIETVDWELELILDDVGYTQESWGDIEDRGLYY